MATIHLKYQLKGNTRAQGVSSLRLGILLAPCKEKEGNISMTAFEVFVRRNIGEFPCNSLFFIASPFNSATISNLRHIKREGVIVTENLVPSSHIKQDLGSTLTQEDVLKLHVKQYNPRHDGPVLAD